jgi:hypothetical protein
MEIDRTTKKYFVPKECREKVVAAREQEIAKRKMTDTFKPLSAGYSKNLSAALEWSKGR